jgi:anti-sigma factor RsiW
VPSAQVAEDFLDDPRVVNDGDNAHWVLANGTPKRIDVPDPEDEIAPAFGGEFGRAMQVSVLTIDTRARPPELVEAFVVARSGPRGS